MYWPLVHSVRSGSRVRQETVAMLGESDAAGRAPARALARMVDVRWCVLASPLVASSTGFPIRGAGLYTYGGEGAPQQRLALLLALGREQPARFDSGWAAGGDGFPRIDARLPQNGATCFDTVIEVHAEPRQPPIRSTPLTDRNAP